MMHVQRSEDNSALSSLLPQWDLVSDQTQIIRFLWQGPPYLAMSLSLFPHFLTHSYT